MATVDITLRITYNEKVMTEPKAWDWYDLLDFYAGDGEVTVRKQTKVAD
jgi:hypothetical protein